MQTAHQNYKDQSGRIYCYKLNDIVSYDQTHIRANCLKCSYLSDSFGDNGVECTFDDHTPDDMVYFIDASDSEKHSQMQTVRLGIDTEVDVNNRLKGFGAETIPIYEDYDAPPPTDVIYEKLDDEDDVENLEVSNENSEISRS